MLKYSLGLIGYPLSHSLSPKLHQAALKAAGLQGEYRLYPIPVTDPPPRTPLPADTVGKADSLPRAGRANWAENELRNVLDKIRAGEVHGLNVTIPYKQTVIPLLDELTPAAQAIGAVNTIYLRAGRLVGENTDAPGFLADLKKLLDETRKPSPRLALVLGAGGAARAVVYALLQASWSVTLAARRIEQAEALANDFSQILTPASRQIGKRPNQPTAQLSITSIPIPQSPSSILQHPISLMVNTTPLGMNPHPDASPWPAGLPFPKNAAVYDLVYNPRETALVRAARAAGLPALTGLGMLIEQAALAFELWTGKRADREAMREAVL